MLLAHEAAPHFAEVVVLDYPIHRFSDLAELSADEMKELRCLGGPAMRYKPNTIIRTEGEPVHCFYLMLEGWATASVDLPAGGRQIMKIHLPGDMLGTPSMASEVAAETLTALTDCAVAQVPLGRMRTLFTSHPRLAALFLMAVQIERIALMDAIAAMGRTDAREQVITFLLDLHHRLDRIALVRDGTFRVPMTQEQIADKLGMTSVHLNRTLRALEAEGAITHKKRTFTLHDLDMLRAISQLPRRKPSTNPSWLPERSSSR